MTQRPTDEFLPSSPTEAQGVTPEPHREPALAPTSPPAKRRSRSGGPPQRKGGLSATRQHFSMSPVLMSAIIDAAHQLGSERATEIVDDRARRITYSKIVAAFAWLLKSRYMNKNGRINDDLRRLVADFEASEYERPDDAKDPDAIMQARRLYAAQIPSTNRDEDEDENDYVDRDEDEDEEDDDD